MNVQAILQSAFLEALAYGLIASVWQMALLWLATVIIIRLVKLSSAQKFNIAYAAQLSGFALFIYNSLDAYNNSAGKITIGIKEANFLADINTFIGTVVPYSALLYLCLLIFKLIKLVYCYNSTQQLKGRELKKISPEQRIFVQQMSELFSLHKKVEIYLSEKILCPLATGFLKPVILIPVAAVNQLTTLQMEAVILHELAHIKRSDYLLFILQSLVEKVFFFNIFSLMLSEIIERERENACDDWVLQFRYSSMHYAEALFKLGRLKALPVLAMPLQGKKESLLLVRIKRLLHNPQPASFTFHSVLLGIASIIVTAGLLMSSSPAETPKQNIAVNLNTVNITKNGQDENMYRISDAGPITASDITAQYEEEKTNEITRQSETTALNETVETAPVVEMDPHVLKVAVNNTVQEIMKLKQNYIYKVRQSLDSVKQILPQYNQAVNAQVVLTEDMLQKAISYQNFKQLEAMLAATGNAITVTEAPISENSYRKQLTIEATDANGNKHIYNVIVELYQ